MSSIHNGMIYDVRTRTIESSIRESEGLDGDSEQKYVDYQPGNGTRYDLLFVKLAPKAAEAAGGQWMVTWIYKRSHVVVSGFSYVHYTYVAEKMGVGVADAIVLAEIIGHVLGCRATTSYEFDPDLKVKEVMHS